MIELLSYFDFYENSQISVWVGGMLSLMSWKGTWGEIDG